MADSIGGHDVPRVSARDGDATTRHGSLQEVSHRNWDARRTMKISPAGTLLDDSLRPRAAS